MKKKTTAAKPLFGVIMGSDSDWPTMKGASEALDEFGIEHEVAVVSAHRMPTEMVKYGQTAHKRGIRVVIAGAGGAAHLPGMVASLTPLPVIGVPVESRALKGMDSLLSIVQMPGGVPVATVAIGGGRNAGLLAVEILGASDPKLQELIVQFKKELSAAAKQRGRNLQKTLKDAQA